MKLSAHASNLIMGAPSFVALVARAAHPRPALAPLLLRYRRPKLHNHSRGARHSLTRFVCSSSSSRRNPPPRPPARPPVWPPLHRRRRRRRFYSSSRPHFHVRTAASFSALGCPAGRPATTAGVRSRTLARHPAGARNSELGLRHSTQLDSSRAHERSSRVAQKSPYKAVVSEKRFLARADVASPMAAAVATSCPIRTSGAPRKRVSAALCV